MITEITVSEQVTSFIYYCLSGFLTGFVFTCFKLFREKSKSATTRILNDISASLLAFTVTLYIFFKINGLRITFYHITGFFMGIMIYFFSVEEKITPPLRIFFKFFKKILIFLLYPARFSCIMILRVCVFLLKPFKLVFRAFKKIILCIRKKYMLMLRKLKKI